MHLAGASMRATFALAAVPDAPAVSDADSGGLVELSGLAVPWDTETVRFGVPVVFTPDTTRVPDDLSTVKLLIQHDDERPWGYATAASFDDDGLRITWATDPSHPRAAEALGDIDRKWRDGLSVGVELDAETWDALWEAMWDPPEDGAPVPLAGELRELSLVSVPQFNAARVAATTASAGGRPLARFAQEGSTMPPTIAPPAPDTAPDSAAASLTLAELAAQLAPFMDELRTASVHPLASFADAGSFFMAAREGRLSDEQRAAFALADQITDNNPGVIQPHWLSTIVGILSRGRPTVQAFGGAVSAGDNGMSISWPYYDGGFDGLIGEQVTEKTEVTTRRVDIKSGSTDLKTYAGASDISYQLLRRSSPSYREAYTRILNIAYAIVSDSAFAAAVLAAAVPPTGGTWVPGTGTLEDLLGVLFAASAQVDDAVGVPADVVLASSDVFGAIGTLSGLVPSAYGTQNVGGTAQASTLRVNVSGLEIRKDRSLPANTLLVASSEAASWAEDGPRAVEADDVAKLGLDVGVWGMGAPLIQVPAGIVAVGDDGVPLSQREGSRSSRKSE